MRSVIDELRILFAIGSSDVVAVPRSRLRSRLIRQIESIRDDDGQGRRGADLPAASVSLATRLCAVTVATLTLLSNILMVPFGSPVPVKISRLPAPGLCSEAVTTGAIVSRMSDKPSDAGDVFPAASDWVAVRWCVPSAKSAT